MKPDTTFTPVPMEAAGYTDHDGYVWPEYKPLDDAHKPMTVNVDTMIPERLAKFRDLVRELAHEIQVPEDAVFMPALALATLGVARVAEVRPYSGLDTTEVAPLWVVVLMPSGSRKSEVVRRLKYHLVKWSRKNKNEMEKPLAKYHVKRRNLEEIIAGLRTKLRNANQENHEAIEREIELKSEELRKMPPLEAPSLVAHDITPEKLRAELQRNGEKIGIIDDEAACLENMMGRYSDGLPNLNLYLKMKTGSSDDTKRVGSGDVSLEGPCGVIDLLIQDSAVEDLLGDKKAHGRGLIPRFQWIRPVIVHGTRKIITAKMPEATAEWWDSTMQKLLDKQWKGQTVLGPDGRPRRCEKEPRILPLSDGAMALFCTLRGVVEKSMADGCPYENMREYANKLPGDIARIALCYEMMANPDATEVGLDSMTAAFHCWPYLASNYRAVVTDRQDPYLLQARKLLKRLDELGGGPVALRDIKACIIKGTC